jgi:UPF0716 protein FxsA
MTFLVLLLLFTVIPAVEIALFVVVGGEIGPLSTFAVVLFTGVAGASLARMQGFAVLMQMQSGLSQGRMPTEELVEGAIVLFGGALLLTPGFMTDLVGLSCLLPSTRKGYAFLLKKWAAKKVDFVGPGRVNAGGFRFWSGGVHPGRGAGPKRPVSPAGFEPTPTATGRGETIDASFSVLDEEDSNPTG